MQRADRAWAGSITTGRLRRQARERRKARLTVASTARGDRATRHAVSPCADGRFRPAPPGGHRGVQRFGVAGHRDRHHLVAVLHAPAATGPCLPTRRRPPAGRCRPRRRARCRRRHPTRSPAAPHRPNPSASWSDWWHAPPGSRAAAPALVRHGHRRYRGRTPLRDQHAVARRTPRPTARSHRGCADRRCCPTRPAAPAAIVGGDREQVVGMGVVVGRHLQRDALMQVVGGHPVQVGTRHLEDGDTGIGCSRDGFGAPLVGFGCRVRRRARSPGHLRAGTPAPGCGRAPFRCRRCA